MTDKLELTPELPKAYEPSQVEQKWYRFWMEKGYFTPKIDPSKKPFVIIQPPPNITGDLHLGHALTATLEDIMVRWHRMLGEPTLWLPGEDHAGIAAQVVVERLLAKEGLTRQQIGREKFLERMWQWVNGCRANIANQHKRLGVSCDWTREKFTLDEGPSRAVHTAFLRLYEKGLIYRGERIINWCPRCVTALSDLEVDHEDVAGHLWYVRYPLAGDKGQFITVATTRPETMLGDTAVAVNPSDERYHALIGKNVILPIIGRVIPIVADEAVGLEFGTGAVKVTPAHDPTDFEISQRHNLPVINILSQAAAINEQGGKYAGMDRFAARKALVADLEHEGYLVKTENYSHAVGHCQRCRTIIEPQASRQWFVKIEPLAKPAIEAVTEGHITIIPERFSRVYLNWMENIRDWCISRQLWWGHRIPVWYCADCSQMTVAMETPPCCSHCRSSHIEQDQDVLDTWFSSGLWPHSTLGWPDDTADLRYFYPTSVMETAYDILFFWVARMIMMGIEDMGDVPFRHVYLHGLIRDERGDKMSKTKGNVVDPLSVMDKYGSDALRFAVITGISPGNDSKLGDTKLEAGRNFANKLYNAARFVLRYMDKPLDLRLDPEMLLLEDRWILSRLNRTIASVNGMMAEFQFGEALRQIHDFIWGEFCDWYIEMVKGRLANGTAPSPLPVLVNVLESSLRLLHPFMPFITEELWQNLKGAAGSQLGAESIMIAAYPMVNEDALDSQAEAVVEILVEIVRALRNTRSEYEVEVSRLIEAEAYAGGMATAIKPYTSVIDTLAKARIVISAERRGEVPVKSLVLVLKGVEMVIPMTSLFDLETEIARLMKELTEAEKEQARLETHLKDEVFLSRAPTAVVEKEKARLEAVLAKQDKLKEHLKRLKE
jgi:valyl-tRNA synthetase